MRLSPLLLLLPSLEKSVSAGDGHWGSWPARSAGTSSGWPILLAAVLIVLATIVAYSNSFRCPFVFDDLRDIVDNTSICRLWPIRDVFMVQSDGRSALHGRPVVNFSLAVNHATGGLEPLHYHVTNLLVHVLAGLTLFGLVRRTLLLPSLDGRFAAAATPLALAVALIWTLHPLQTGAVTYVIQRYESMMGLFYLLAFYAAVRCGTSEHPGRWAVVSVAATLLALGCKEVAVSIPITILLYDRAFLAGSFREAWRRRPWLYVGLAAAWLPFAILLLSSYDRSNFAGYGLPVTWIEYARSQFGVILHYLRLTFWPCPLVLDYGWPVARTVGQIVPAAVVIVGLVAATGYALIRWPKWGFLGAWFFLILAPTSSVLPILDLAFEHRMYLPLAAVAAGVVMGGYVVGRRLVVGRRISRPALQAVSACLLILGSVVLGILTFQRNADYRSELSIWEDTIAKAPHNDRAHYNLGVALAGCQRGDEAIVHYRKALEINPNYAHAHNNLGLALADRGRIEEAIANYRKALESEPNCAIVHFNLGLALAGCGQLDEAIVHYRKALEISPQVAEFHCNLGIALARLGQFDEMTAEYRKALAIDPDYADAHNHFGVALAGRGRLDEAISHFQEVLKIKPDYTEARNNLGIVQSQREGIVKGLAARRELLRSHPDDIALLNETAWMLAANPNASVRNAAEAVELAERAVQLSGTSEAAVLDTLAAAYAEAGRFPEALQTARKAAELATRQNNRPLAESINAKISLYEAGTPFRAMPQPPAADSTRP